MDETTKTIIARITVNHAEPDKLSDGTELRSTFRTAELNPNELARLSADAVGHLDETLFDVAVGLAYSGILFAAAVAGGRPVAIMETTGKIWGPTLAQKKVILVDDVVYSADRFTVATKNMIALGAQVVGYAAIVDASHGRVMTLPAPLWSAFQAGV